jgi:hypothetical protein
MFQRVVCLGCWLPRRATTALSPRLADEFLRDDFETVRDPVEILIAASRLTGQLVDPSKSLSIACGLVLLEAVVQVRGDVTRALD